MNKIILPLGNSPIITYTNYGYPISSFCYDDKYNNWFYSNYANLNIVNPSNEIKMNFISGDAFGGVKPLRYNQDNNIDDLIDDIIAKLSDGWYIYTYVNYKYINVDFDFFHNILIHGINLNEKIIHATGYKFDRFNQFGEFKISIDDFCKAYYDEDNKNKDRYIFWKPRNEKEKFLYKNFKIQLEDYLNSSFDLSQIDNYYYNTDHMTTVEGIPMEEFIIDGHKKNKYIYGIACGSFLKDLLDRERAQVQEYVNIDLRLFRSYWEHKKIMNKRFVYFLNNKTYPFDMSLFIEKSREIEEKARIIFNYLIKCQMTNKKPKDISYYFNDIYLQEIDIYNKFLNLVEKTNC